MLSNLLHTVLLVLVSTAAAARARARAGAQAQANGTGETHFLDHDKALEPYDAKQWLAQTIPFIDIPDKDIQDVYYYRWGVVQRHLHYTYPGHGYMLTEFIHAVGYAQKYGSINAAAGHMINEARWLRDPRVVDDMVRLYSRGGGNSTQYSHWIQAAALNHAKLTGGMDKLAAQLAGFVAAHDDWEPRFDRDPGLYYYTAEWDAQEYSLTGYWYSQHNSKDGKDMDMDMDRNGPEVYRPSINAYMVANARAIAEIARHAGDHQVAARMAQRADTVERAMLDTLWDDDMRFFLDVVRDGKLAVKGRQEVGLYPFRFGIGLHNRTYTDGAVDQLFDRQGFYARYGPTTLERRNAFFADVKPDDYCCYWNGQSWPFSTAHTLGAMAHMARHHNRSTLTAEQFLEYMNVYARTQMRHGVPFVAESHYPDLGVWSGNSLNHSEHYFHSTNNDNVLGGLLGIVPQLNDTLEINPIVPANWSWFAVENLQYHGHAVTVLWDETGQRYGQKPGLSVYINGQLKHNAKELKQTVVNVPPAAKNDSGGGGGTLVNIAVNAVPQMDFPRVNTTDDNDKVQQINDGFEFYDQVPNNRWVNNITHKQDTIQLTWPRTRHGIDSFHIGFYSDAAHGGLVDCPAGIDVATDGGTVELAHEFECKPNDKVKVAFKAPVSTQRLWVTVHNKPGRSVGVAELEVWVPHNNNTSLSSGTYHAVDGASVRSQFKDAGVKMVFDNSTIEFGGVMRSAPGNATLDLSYHADRDAVVECVVNSNVHRTQRVHLQGGSSRHRMQVELGAGWNYVLFQGAADVVYDNIQVH